MTHKLPPDPARYSALLAPPRMHRLAVCLRGTTAFSPSLSMLAALIVSLAQGIVSQAAFPEAMLAPRRRRSVPSGTAADPALCEATPCQRSPAARPRQHGCAASGGTPSAPPSPRRRHNPPTAGARGNTPCPAGPRRRSPRRHETPANRSAAGSGRNTPPPAAAAGHRHRPDAADRVPHGAADGNTPCPAANARAVRLPRHAAHPRRPADSRRAGTATPHAQRQPRPPEERCAGRRLPRRTPLRCPHSRRRKLPAAGHAQRPLPDARRHEHRSTHRSRP